MEQYSGFGHHASCIMFGPEDCSGGFGNRFSVSLGAGGRGEFYGQCGPYYLYP